MKRSMVAAVFLLSVVLSGRGAWAIWDYKPANSGFILGSVVGHSISVPAAYTYNSSGYTNGATYVGVGNYNVTFPGLAIPLFPVDGAVGGDVQVTAVGTSARCKVNNWTANGTTGIVGVNVRCYSLSGNPVENSFRASFVSRTNSFDAYNNRVPFQEGAYVWAYQPSSSPYQATGAYTWNSALGAVYITPHSSGPAGSYIVQFVGQIGGYDFQTVPVDPCSGYPAYNGGTFQVTAYGAGNSYCKVGNTYRDWNDTYAEVFCFSGSNGSPIDSMFDLVYDTMSPNAINNSAFTFDDQPTTSPYSPAWDAYTAVIVPRTDDNYCPYYVSNLTTITRSSTGKYSVFFPDISLGNTSLFHASAYGSGSETCGNAGASLTTYQGIPGITLSINCVSFSGSPTDTPFLVSYAADGVISVH